MLHIYSQIAVRLRVRALAALPLLETITLVRWAGYHEYRYGHLKETKIELVRSALMAKKTKRTYYRQVIIEVLEVFLYPGDHIALL